jgi:peroxiredoxin
MERATAELIASGQAARTIKAGDRAPQFTLKDQDANEVWSADLLARGPLVVTFYCGVWCPDCNIELQAIKRSAAADSRLRCECGRHFAADAGS